MIYLLIPRGDSDWKDMRMFTSFSSVEQVVDAGIKDRAARNVDTRWCFVVAYEGTDELSPVWGYMIYEGYLQRCAITQSL